MSKQMYEYEYLYYEIYDARTITAAINVRAQAGWYVTSMAADNNRVAIILQREVDA